MAKMKGKFNTLSLTSTVSGTISQHSLIVSFDRPAGRVNSLVFSTDDNGDAGYFTVTNVAGVAAGVEAMVVVDDNALEALRDHIDAYFTRKQIIADAAEEAEWEAMNERHKPIFDQIAIENAIA